MARIVGIQHIVQYRTYLWAHFLVHRLNQEKLRTHPSQHCQWSQDIRNAGWTNNNAVQYNKDLPAIITIIERISSSGIWMMKHAKGPLHHIF